MPSMAALPTFADGKLVQQGQLNSVTAGVDTLCQITTGKTASSGVASKPIGYWYRNANQSIASGTDTIVSWTTESYDTDNMWSVGAADHLLIATPGKYVITAQVDWTPNATGYRAQRILLNGTNRNTDVISEYSFPVTGSAVESIFQVETYPLALVAGDVIYLQVRQQSGVALSAIGAADPKTVFGGTWISAEWVAP